MEIVGRLCQTLIQKHRPIAAFLRMEPRGRERHRRAAHPGERAGANESNDLRIAALLVLIPFVHTSPLRAAETKIWEGVSVERAFVHVQRVVHFGPGPPVCKAIEKSRDYIEDQL